MNKIELLIKMYEERDNFNPPLEIKDIIEIVNTETPFLKRQEEFYDWSEKLKSVDKYILENKNKQYTTKTSIRQEIKNINKEIDEFVDLRRRNIGYMNDIWIEEAVERKKKLQALLNRPKLSKDSTDKESVKTIPISSFIEFNRSNFAKCIWHDDKNPSMKYYPKTNSVYCFSCQKSGDVIDVVGQINHCTFVEAMKILKNYI